MSLSTIVTGGGSLRAWTKGAVSRWLGPGQLAFILPLFCDLVSLFFSVKFSRLSSWREEREQVNKSRLLLDRGFTRHGAAVPADSAALPAAGKPATRGHHPVGRERGVPQCSGPFADLDRRPPGRPDRDVRHRAGPLRLSDPRGVRRPSGLRHCLRKSPPPPTST